MTISDRSAEVPLANTDALEQLTCLPLPRIAEALGCGQVSAKAMTRHYLDRIERFDSTYRAYITVTAEAAERQAHAADRALAEGRQLGPLHGVPIALKDLCETIFAPTSNGMAIFRNRNTGRQAAVVDALLRAGAICLGKLAMAEGACSTHHPLMPVPVNPWGAGFRTGSSSSGSGVAVAARLCAAAVGSDTGGSIRFPAAYCGVTGLKPSRDLVNRHGICSMAPSLDHVGPMASDAEGCALMLRAMIASPPLDGPDMRGARLGYFPAMFDGRIDLEIEAAYRRLLEMAKQIGLELVACDLPDVPDQQDVWSCICAYETAQSHARTFAVAREDYGQALAALIAQGLDTPRERYETALARQADIAALWQRLSTATGWLALPIHSAPPPLLDNSLGAPNTGAGNPLQFTTAANLSGLPTLALPMGPDRRGCPMGLQIMGAMASDFALLALGANLQSRGA